MRRLQPPLRSPAEAPWIAVRDRDAWREWTSWLFLGHGGTPRRWSIRRAWLSSERAVFAMFDGSVHDIRRSDIIAVWIGVATLRGSRVNLPGRSIRVINLPHELFLPAWSACPVTAALDEAFHVGGE